MDILYSLGTLIAVIVIMMRCLDLVAHLNHSTWAGHFYALGGFSLSVALTAGGSVGVLFGWHQGAVMLLLGFAGWLAFDRRKHH